MVKKSIDDCSNTSLLGFAYFVLHPSFKIPFFVVKNSNLFHRKSGLRFYWGRRWVYEKHRSDAFHSKIDLRVVPKGVGKYVNLCPSPSVSNPNWLMAFRSTYELRLASYANKSINNKVFLSSYVVFWMEEK